MKENMKKSKLFRRKWSYIAIFLLAILCISAVSYIAPLKTKKANITYIANEGFLIQIAEKRIMIDAFFGEQALSFCAVPAPEALEQMTKATGDFAKVDLIAVTHNHVDHFHAPLVAEHLLANEHAKFISCEQSTEKLAEQKGYDSFGDRVIEITPDSLYYQDTLINDIGVRVYRLAHGPYMETDLETGLTVNRHRFVQNLGFVFEVDGIRIFHCGDSSPRCWDDYEHFHLEREGIDIALLGRGFLASDVGFGIDIIRDFIQPEHIVLMHIHPESIPYYQNVANQVKDEFPSVTIFESLMDTKEFLVP
jgi:L-ascorbate metabolism protein UlaG (beta-lactamase superfamily)